MVMVGPCLLTSMECEVVKTDPDDNENLGEWRGGCAAGREVCDCHQPSNEKLRCGPSLILKRRYGYFLALQASSFNHLSSFAFSTVFVTRAQLIADTSGTMTGVRWLLHPVSVVLGVLLFVVCSTRIW